LRPAFFRLMAEGFYRAADTGKDRCLSWEEFVGHKQWQK
jgi:hypothetical protein